jgi:hypothetical protein
MICTFDFDFNTAVTLTAAPDAASTFAGWSGACSGTSTCVVTMNQAVTVTATFDIINNPTLTVAKTGTGAGTVTSQPAGIDCGTACSATFAPNTQVTLTASPAAPSTFEGWSGACSGDSPTCVVTMNQAQTVTAVFNQSGQPLIVSKTGTGDGTVTSSPAGIDCGSDCSQDYPFNSIVTLQANPANSSTFGGWGGACSGNATTCVVTMNQAQNVIATFDVRPAQTLTVTKTGVSGRVTSSPAGINCDIACSSASFNFPFGTSVTLTASITLPFGTFIGWEGACAGNAPTCTVTMDQFQSVTAIFSP